MKVGKVALAVGINSYPNRPLSVCVDDVKEIHAALSMPEYGYKVTTLIDGDVTRKGLKRALDFLFRSKADTYLFYFSGHGWATDLGVYLVTVDHDLEEPGLEIDHLRKLILNVAPEQSSVVVILDCCHSGAATPKDLSPVGIDARSQDLMKALPGLPRGRVLLAACRGDQMAYEDPSVGHSVFTSHLLQGLIGEAADSEGAITVVGLFDFVSRAIKRSGLQEPMLRGDISGRLVLGDGFIPRYLPVLSEDRLIELERDARRHVADYQSRVAPAFADISAWKADGHKTACQMLEPILDWFDRQLREIPVLQSRHTFMAERDTAVQRLSTLCGLDADTVTIEGIAKSRLGTGAFGTVWRVERDNPLPPLAYKVYHAQEIAIEDKVTRFRHGYEAMKQLDHPYIVKVHRYTVCPLGFYMDFIDGPNFRNFVGTLEEPREMVDILLTVAETLRHAHNRNVYHRDVKPENIILTFDSANKCWNPYLTDFDLAWFPTATQITKEAIGVVHYAAPEQLANPSAASAHAPTVDSYAFAQLSFFAITGSNPVPLGVADNKRALEERIRAGWVVDAAEEFIKLYSECSETKPTKRPNLEDICGRLFHITQLLGDVSELQRLPHDRFLKEIIFSMVGLSSGSAPDANSFLSLSGKTRVRFELKEDRNGKVSLTYDFHSQDSPILQGIHTFEQLRKTLLGRIDEALASFPGARKRHGHQPPFQVFVDHNDLSSNLRGVATARALVSRVLNVIEGR